VRQKGWLSCGREGAADHLLLWPSAACQRVWFLSAARGEKPWLLLPFFLPKESAGLWGTETTPGCTLARDAFL